jgi:hypothetical protein
MQGIRANKACYPAIHYYLAASGSLSRIIASANYVTLITGRDVKVRFDRRTHGRRASVAVR